MVTTQFIAWAVCALLLVYFAVEFGWGGGNPSHKDHNPLNPWPF